METPNKDTKYIIGIDAPTKLLGNHSRQEEDVHNLVVYGTSDRNKVKLIIEQMEYLKTIKDLT